MHRGCVSVTTELMTLGAFKAACSIPRTTHHVPRTKWMLILRRPLVRRFWGNQCDAAHPSGAWLSLAVLRHGSAHVHGLVI